MTEIDVKKEFKSWCKDSKRSGGVLVGSSIQEFLTHIQTLINNNKTRSNDTDHRQNP